jgi:hypothetical protein
LKRADDIIYLVWVSFRRGRRGKKLAPHVSERETVVFLCQYSHYILLLSKTGKEMFLVQECQVVTREILKKAFQGHEV